jgi:hypothetical protein
MAGIKLAKPSRTGDEERHRADDPPHKSMAMATDQERNAGGTLRFVRFDRVELRFTPQPQILWHII